MFIFNVIGLLISLMIVLCYIFSSLDSQLECRILGNSTTNS